MTENQLYTSFRHEQALSTNLCDCANQDIVFDLEKYGPYLDKIRALLVPSLEYRICSLLEEFVYSTNSRWAKQFPCFKKFIDTIVMWKDPLIRAVECDIGTMEEKMRNIIKHIIKDDLLTCFLDSVILHHRLNKVCRELDVLGIEDNILKSLNMWNFVNEQDCSLDCNCFKDFNTTMDCNMNLNMVSCNAKRPIKYKTVIKPLAKNVYNRSIKHTRPTTTEYREHRRILDPNQNYLQQRKDNLNHYSTCVATGSQNNTINKINRSFNERPCNIKLKKIRKSLKLKIIVYKIYLEEDYKCSTISSFNVTRLPLPCKPSNLVRQIFKANPSLTESCLIVIKQKFENSMHNVCSCLNSILEKLNIKLTKSLCLNCEIYPGYISFKLKANNIKKCLFVARVPICQNVCKRTIQQDYFILSSRTNSKSSTEINESKCFEQCKEIDMNFNNTFERINEKTEKVDACCSQMDQNFIKDMTIDMSQNEAENNNEKKITYMIAENISKDVQNHAISSCNNSYEDIIEEISNMTSCVDNSKERNGKYYKSLSSTEINCNDNVDNVEKCKKRIFEPINSITKTDTSTQLVNNVNCMCLSYENFIEVKDEIENICSNKDLDAFSQTSGTNKHDWICLSNKKSNLENEVCNANTCSITSFVQNSECDKQLVELNYNHFSNNNAIDERSDTQKNDSSLNSAKVEIEYNSCRHDDVIDITVINDISKENIVCAFKTSQDNFDEVKARSMGYSKTLQISPTNDNLLTISVQMPRSTLSKGINMDTCSETVWLISDDDESKSTVMKTSDRYNKVADFPTHALIAPKKVKNILSDTNKEIFNVKDGTQDFITSSKKFSTSKERFQSNKNSRNSGISTGEYLRAGDRSTCATSNASLYYRSFVTTSEFTINNKQDKFQKSDKSKKLSKLCGRGYIRSHNSTRNVTSTMIKHRPVLSNDYPAKIRPQMILAMTKFRNSVDKSVDRIKRLIRAKLGKILFNDKISNNNKVIKTFWRNKESSEDIRRKKTSSKCIRQGYSVTSCSTCDYCKQGYTTSSRESSNVILSIRRMRRKRSEENIKFRDHRLTDGSKASLNFRSINNSPWSYDFLTSTTENIQKEKLNKNNQYGKKKKIRNAIDYNRDFRRCDLKHSGTSTTISSQSTKISLIENDSKYFGHHMYKQQNEICDNMCICEQVHNQDQRKNEQVWHEYRHYGKKYRDVPIKCSNVDNNKSLKTSSSRAWKGNAKNVDQQFYDRISEMRNVKRFASSRKNRQTFEKDVSDYSIDSLISNGSLLSNGSLRKRHVFAILTDVCNDYMNDLDLDFKLKLLRYVELCKSMKRSLMRTLQQDDIYEISTIFSPR